MRSIQASWADEWPDFALEPPSTNGHHRLPAVRDGSSSCHVNPWRIGRRVPAGSCVSPHLDSVVQSQHNHGYATTILPRMRCLLSFDTATPPGSWTSLGDWCVARWR
eukprot:scaffold2927_cov408-Prasinococcus_capsulatus_cf.AAC.7